MDERDFSWIISEYAKPITSYQQFNKLAGFNLEQVKKEITSKNGENYLDSLYDSDGYEDRGNQFAAMVFQLVDEYYDRNDFGNLDKYGISRDGRVILVDYGTLT